MIRAQKGYESIVYKLGFIIQHVVLGYELKEDYTERECIVEKKTNKQTKQNNKTQELSV